MLSLSSPLKDTIEFEPLFIDLIGDELTEQHARILALLFKLGGYTSLNVLTERLAMAQSTVSVRVEELVKKGLIRKNTELMPIVLVLLLDLTVLSSKLYERMDTQQNAVQIIKKVAESDNNLQILEASFRKAIRDLFPNDEILSNMVAEVYLHQVLTRDELFDKLSPNGNIDELASHYDSILTYSKDIFQITYGKQRKTEMYIRPRLPLKIFVKIRLNYLESLMTHYKDLLQKLREYISEDFDSFKPIQNFNYPSEIKAKIDTCLKNYSSVRVIDNLVCQGKKGLSLSVSELITQSEHFGRTNKKGVEKQEHKVFILSRQEPSVIKRAKSPKIRYQEIKGAIHGDIRARDFVFFDNHVCLVFPSIPNVAPYYSISPRYIARHLKIFESYWK